MSADRVLARLLLDLAVVVVAAALLRVLLARFGQPRVLAEVMAGIVLGPTLLGRLPGDPTTFLFPREVHPALGLVGALGLTLFVFAVGLELDLAAMRRRSRLVASVSAGSLALPFATGLGLASVLYGAHRLVGGHAVPPLAFALFLATSMAVTAFPVLASILVERGIRSSALGELALGSAALQDAVGWVLLAVTLAVLSGHGGGHILRVVVATATFVLVLAFVARPLLAAVLRAGRAGRECSPVGRASRSAALVSIAVTYATVCAGVTQLIGVHEVLGAFAAGVTFPREEGLEEDEERRVVTHAVLPITFSVLLPVYFLTPGLAINAGAISGSGLAELGLIVAAACASKALGAGVSARCGGIPWREVLPLAVLLNTRGLMELVVLTVGYTEGVLDRSLFSELVMMALLTTMMTGPLLDGLRRRGIVAAGERGAGLRGEWDDPVRPAVAAAGLVSGEG